MLLEEFKRCWNPKINIVIAAPLFLMLGIATWQNYLEGQQFSQLLAYAYLESDIEYLSMMVEGWTGFFLFERLFFFSTDYLSMFWMICMIGMGIHIGSSTFSALQSGYGVKLLTRMSYSNYLKKTLLSSIFYMSTFILAIFVVSFMCLFLLGGGGFQVPILSDVGNNAHIVYYFFILFALVVYSIICMIPLILIALLSPVILKNKYIIQFMPVGIMVGSYVFAFIFGNTLGLPRFLAGLFIFESALVSLTGIISPYRDHLYGNGPLIATIVLHPLILFAISIALFKSNIAKLGADYLL